jgi:hypothetical protein
VAFALLSWIMHVQWRHLINERLSQLKLHNPDFSNPVHKSHSSQVNMRESVADDSVSAICKDSSIPSATRQVKDYPNHPKH